MPLVIVYHNIPSHHIQDMISTLYTATRHSGSNHKKSLPCQRARAVAQSSRRGTLQQTAATCKVLKPTSPNKIHGRADVVEKRGVRHHRANNSRPPGLCIVNLCQRLYSKVNSVSVKTVDRSVGECKSKVSLITPSPNTAVYYIVGTH
jgi:hypothetical protein